ncbi:MAG: right-handed parallel beta-helix repeat-containing protein [Spirochaetaceae bacterium]|jgi:hypothetical protein|nr:right-handed parallel beta-helix repeat-containing protein [Spirochaetaceae bacterium]
MNTGKRIIFGALIVAYCAAGLAAKDRLAVMPFLGGEGDEGEAIAELFSFTPELNVVFEPIPRTSLNEAINAEHQTQISQGLITRESVDVLSENLGTQYMACGKITRLGTQKILIISIIDVIELRQIAGDVTAYTEIADIITKLPSMALAITAMAQQNFSILPRLAVAPVELSGGADPEIADALAQILAVYMIRNGKYSVYPRTSNIDQIPERTDDILFQGNVAPPNMTLSVRARRLGAVTLFNAAIIDLVTMTQVIGSSVDYQSPEDGIWTMKSLALRLSAMTTTYTAADAVSFSSAVENINLNNAGWEYTVTVDGSFAIPGVSFTANGEKVITITGASPSILSNSDESSVHFTIPGGITMILGNNVTLGGNGKDSVAVDVKGGTFILKAGAMIKGGKWGGVMVRNGGSFTMEGGVISGNTKVNSNGGGVYVSKDSRFIMKNGIITGNTADYGGGVYVSGSGAWFIMEGGTVSGNTASVSGGGVYVSGQGAEFTMSGTAAIRGNSAKSGGGVYIDSGRFVKTGGVIDASNLQADGNLVFVYTGNKKRKSVAGQNADLDSAKTESAGGWE